MFSHNNLASKALRHDTCYTRVHTVLPATKHKPYLPLFPSHRASPPFGWYSLLFTGWPMMEMCFVSVNTSSSFDIRLFCTLPTFKHRLKTRLFLIAVYSSLLSSSQAPNNCLCLRFSLRADIRHTNVCILWWIVWIGVTLSLSTHIEGKNFSQGGHKFGIGLDFDVWLTVVSLALVNDFVCT